MILDADLLLSDAQAVTADAASTNTYDKQTAARDIFAGETMGVLFQVDTAAASDSAGTFEFQVIQSSATNLSSPDILVKTDTTYLAQATLVAGYLFLLSAPAGLVTKRYLGAYYNVGGTNPTITVTAYVCPAQMARRIKAYPNGYTISH